MDLEPTPKTKDLQRRLTAFMEEHIYPNEPLFHDQIRQSVGHLRPSLKS